MIKTICKKFIFLLTMLAFTAGVFILTSGFVFEKRLPKNVEINGESVGGLPVSEAKARIRANIERELKDKKLEVAGEFTYTYSFPEINYKDNLNTLLESVEKGKSYTAEIKYYLCGLNEVASAICCNESISVTEPYAQFMRSGKPFEYFEGNDGRVVDEKKLKDDIRASLSGGFESVKLSYKYVARKESLQAIKDKTKLLSSFTTYFDSENLNRTSNIRLAASKINGAVIKSGETLSFNQTVGAREKSRGFLPAKIIENGEFTEGVGGGVCQVSTTLYNAALLGGLKAAEYHPHSLAVGYVPPSRDAMVSGSSCDLKITNDYDCPVYIRAETVGGSVSFRIYGGGDGAEYTLSSEVTGSVPREEEITDDPDKAREGKDGILSESYLIISRDGYVKRVLLRKDKYLPVKKLSYIADESL